MKLSQIGEETLLESIRKTFSHCSRNIVHGIGDDAAVLRQSSKYLFVSTDMMVEGIHFNLRFITPYQLGFKLVTVTVSDMYAMGCTPQYLLLNIGLHKDTTKYFINTFFAGIQAALLKYNCDLIGGDLSSVRRDISLSAVSIGGGKKILSRKGAQPGEKIYVTGFLGDAACGLELLKRMNKPVPITCSNTSRIQSFKGLSRKILQPLLKRHLLPDLKKPAPFVKHASSMMDISDGLLIDLSRLCKESQVGAKIYSDKIPVSSELRIASIKLGLSCQKLALTGGEDYELLFTSPRELKRGAYHIGDIVESGTVLIGKNGQETPFSPEGYQHFL
jgi:thiamine-monophosphate kinase